MAIAQDLINQLARVLASEGIPGVLTRPGETGTGLAVRFLMKHPGMRDEAIVNAYGVGAQIITLPVLPEFVAAPPEKFDTIRRADGDPLPYVFDAVVRREVAGIVVAYTAFVKGKGA